MEVVAIVEIYINFVNKNKNFIVIYGMTLTVWCKKLKKTRLVVFFCSAVSSLLDRSYFTPQPLDQCIQKPTSLGSSSHAAITRDDYSIAFPQLYSQVLSHSTAS